MLKSCINEISKTEENKNSMLGFPPPYFPDMFAPRGFSEIIRMAQSKQGRTIAKAPSLFFSSIEFDTQNIINPCLYI